MYKICKAGHDVPGKYWWWVKDLITHNQAQGYADSVEAARARIDNAKTYLAIKPPKAVRGS